MKFSKVIASIAAASLAVSSFAVSAFAAWDGADGSGNLIIDMANLLPEGVDISEVYGVRVTFTDDAAAVVAEGAGGGFILSSAGNNWNQLQWCNGCDPETHDIVWDADAKTITRMEEKPFFTAEDVSGADGTYGQLALSEWWGGDIAYSKIELLNKDGEVLPVTADEPADDTEEVKADIAYTDGLTPSYTYTVKGDAKELDVKVAVSPADGDAFGWNDWCGAGVAVKSTDGTVKYYQYGGKSVNWDWGNEDLDVTYSEKGIDGETWLGTVDAENGGEFAIPVQKDDVVEFYCLSWDKYTGVQYTLTLSEVAEDVDPNPGESSGEVPEPGDTEKPAEPGDSDKPVEPGDSDKPVEPGDSNKPADDNKNPVNPDSGVAVAVVPAAVAAAAVAAAGIVLKKRSK